jgi:hypothetical protein
VSPNERKLYDFVAAAGGSANLADMFKQFPEITPGLLTTLNGMPELVFSHATSNFDRWYRLRTKAELGKRREELGDEIENATFDIARCLTAEVGAPE